MARADRQVLLLWRHRFITGSWGWEVPLGRIEDGESPAEAAAREFEEETGWRAGPLRHLISVHPTPGISDSAHHVYRADEATHLGSPADAFESERIAWVPLDQVPALIGRERSSARPPRPPCCTCSPRGEPVWIGAHRPLAGVLPPETP